MVVGGVAVVVGAAVVVVGVAVVTDATVVVGVAGLVVVGAAFDVADASVAAVLVVAVSEAPPEQAETNTVRTRNPATPRLMG